MKAVFLLLVVFVGAVLSASCPNGMADECKGIFTCTIDGQVAVCENHVCTCGTKIGNACTQKDDCHMHCQQHHFNQHGNQGNHHVSPHCVDSHCACL